MVEGHRRTKQQLMALLPEDLQCLGNAAAWQRVDELLAASSPSAKAILVHGPVGCSDEASRRRQTARERGHVREGRI